MACVHMLAALCVQIHPSTKRTQEEAPQEPSKRPKVEGLGAERTISKWADCLGRTEKLLNREDLIPKRYRQQLLDHGRQLHATVDRLKHTTQCAVSATHTSAHSSAIPTLLLFLDFARHGKVRDDGIRAEMSGHEPRVWCGFCSVCVRLQSLTDRTYPDFPWQREDAFREHIQNLIDGCKDLARTALGFKRVECYFKKVRRSYTLVNPAFASVHARTHTHACMHVRRCCHV